MNKMRNEREVTTDTTEYKKSQKTTMNNYIPIN